MKIAIVDDDNIIRIGLSKIVEKLNDDYKVVGSFQNGALALDYLKKHGQDIDLVITDIKMPLMTGVELIETSIKELEKPPLFIVLSGYDEFNYVRDSMKFGAFNYLLKPIKKDELKNIIQEVQEKINHNKNDNILFNKSIEILKKDLFKSILFSNKELGKKNDNPLLRNMQLDENYVYKMIVIDRNDESINLVTAFIKEVVKEHTNIEYSSFYYKNIIYIIFYINNKKYNDFNEIIESIVEKADYFIENKINMYVLETTDEVWKLREQSNLVRNVKEKILNNMQPKTYFLNNETKLAEIFERDDNQSNDINVIKLAKEYIINNFNKNITLKDVADEVFLSQNYLSELFKKEIGEGFYEFLSNYRIKKAKEILVTTNLKVYEIAKMVGYNDSISFGRAFKKITGTTPNNFRNNKED